MAFTTKAEITDNVALLLGEENAGGTLSDTSQIGINRAMSDRFDSAKRAVLQTHPWKFATEMTVLRTKAGIRDITGITAATPPVLTYSGTDIFADGDLVRVTDVVGMTEVNDTDFIVTNINTGANTFELYDTANAAVVGAGYTAYSSAGEVRLKPAFKWENAYDLPTDLLRVLEVDCNDTPFEVKGRQIFTDGTNLELKYITDFDLSANDVSDELFGEALSLYLAWQLTAFIQADESVRERLLRDYREVLGRARFVDATQQGRRMLVQEDGIQERFASMGRRGDVIYK